MPVYIEEEIAVREPEGARHWWRAKSLNRLDASLTRQGAPLVFFRGDPAVLLPDLARRLKADRIVSMEAVDPDGLRTQSRLAMALSGQPVELRLFPADYLIPPRIFLQEDPLPGKSLRLSGARPNRTFPPPHRSRHRTYWTASLLPER